MSSDNQFTALGPADVGFQTDGANIKTGADIAGQAIGIHGRCNRGDGVVGESAVANKSGVFGFNTAASGGAFGVSGTTASPNGSGVNGFAGSGNGVIGTSQTNDGVAGSSSVAGKSGVFGFNTVKAGAAFGVSGTTASADGSGVNGFADSANGVIGTSNKAYGVFGSTAEHNHAGVRGENTGGGHGVEGVSTGTLTAIRGDSTGQGIGVIGTSSNATGVWALGTSGVTGLNSAAFGAAIFGANLNSGIGLAGRFVGDVQVNGNLSKSSGSFKIDHPLDPENKYLYHSFVESPDMMNVYNGNVTTDGKGEASVALPAYFGALNRDFRYQLTVIGQFARAIVADKIRDNRFTIKTDQPNVEVSWQVTGIRKDAYANAHRINVEEEKSPWERGSLLHPEAFGRSPKSFEDGDMPDEAKQLIKIHRARE